MERLERFLRQVHFLPIEALETLRAFGEVKSLSIRKNSGFFKMWFQKMSGLP